MLKAGSLVFTPPKHPVDTRDWSQWWNFKFGADWRRPVRAALSRSKRGRRASRWWHCAYRDAVSLAPGGPGKELPTEAEWISRARRPGRRRIRLGR
jgi:hypothetical protein